MLNGPLARFLAWRLGLPLDKPEEANRLYLEKLDAELASSRRVGKAVLLGMDGVYGPDGRLDEGQTHFLIANDAVFEACAAFPRFLPGASINPARRDAVDELERCAARGARLIKVLPNAQVFDPSDARFLPFYRALARLKLPILSHVGFEFSLIGHDQSMGAPARWRAALDEGVALIAAHGCSRGTVLYEPHLAEMAELASRYERFFVDTSALTLPNRFGALLRLRRYPQVFDRLLFGTDYPLPCFAFPCLAAGRVSGYLNARKAGSRFDRQAAVLDALGIPPGRDFEEVFPVGSRL